LKRDFEDATHEVYWRLVRMMEKSREIKIDIILTF